MVNACIIFKWYIFRIYCQNQYKGIGSSLKQSLFCVNDSTIHWGKVHRSIFKFFGMVPHIKHMFCFVFSLIDFLYKRELALD